MFLGISVDVNNWSTDGNAFSLMMTENPLTEFVELPVQYQDLQYCNLLCGVIKGALEMVQLNVMTDVLFNYTNDIIFISKVDCRFVRDVLRGDDVSELRYCSALL